MLQSYSSQSIQQLLKLQFIYRNSSNKSYKSELWHVDFTFKLYKQNHILLHKNYNISYHFWSIPEIIASSKLTWLLPLWTVYRRIWSMNKACDLGHHQFSSLTCPFDIRECYIEDRVMVTWYCGWPVLQH